MSDHQLRSPAAHDVELDAFERVMSAHDPHPVRRRFCGAVLRSL